jgi:glucoamylase
MSFGLELQEPHDMVASTEAPGAPGIEPRWTSSAKTGVGTALTRESLVWFTLSHGILNEVYYPDLDCACIRDFGLIVTGPKDYFAEEKRHAGHAIEPFETGVPAYRLTNTALDGCWRIDKRVLSDPARPVVLQEICFSALKGDSGDYRVYALLAPHLVNAGKHNDAWIGEHAGRTILFAAGRGTVLALASSLPWRVCSAGYVGASDGWQQLYHEGRLDRGWRRAGDGNVALTGEIGFSEGVGTALLALGFGDDAGKAADAALASLDTGFEGASRRYLRGWRNWQKRLAPLDEVGAPGAYRVSMAVLAAHLSRTTPGAAVASLSVPWGFSKGDDDLGGYHLVWPRDLVETAGGLVAAGDLDAALTVLYYLRSLQRPDGSWPQNAWIDGRTYWNGIQMDECAFPILLADLLRRKDGLDRRGLAPFMPMIRRAASYLVANGPVTGEDRWEEDPGYSPFTLAVEIAALLAAADLFDLDGDPEAARYLRETADCWNDQVERWTYVEGTELCARLGVDGYHVRIAPPDDASAASPKDGFVPIKNRPPCQSSLPARQVVSPDALALVRFGLRAPDDPRILGTVRVVDATLRCPLPQGPLWYRYTDDGYGEHADGAPFDGSGQGRPWPLLAGERAHYELAAGRPDEARRLLAALEGSAGQGGLIPEQVWDGPDMPERELSRGRPSDSAMPLVWAHAEHVKLLRSLADGTVFDRPPQGVARYIAEKTTSPLRIWRFNHKIRSLPAGKLLRIETSARARIHWSADDWTTTQDVETAENAFGVHLVDLPVADRRDGAIIFTFFWLDAGHWETIDFTVAIEPPAADEERR